MIVNANVPNKRPTTIEAVLEAADVTVGNDTVNFTVDATLTGRTFKHIVGVRSSAGLQKAGFTSVYSTVTGVLSVSDTGAGFATGDVITVIGYLL